MEHSPSTLIINLLLSLCSTLQKILLKFVRGHLPLKVWSQWCVHCVLPLYTSGTLIAPAYATSWIPFNGLTYPKNTISTKCLFVIGYKYIRAHGNMDASSNSSEAWRNWWYLNRKSAAQPVALFSDWGQSHNSNRPWNPDTGWHRHASSSYPWELMKHIILVMLMRELA